MRLLDLLTLERIRVNVKAKDWKDAIRNVGELMVKTQCVEERYIDAMIKVAESLGPYIVIVPGVAFPHARPEDGVISPCFALITLEEPINFGNPQNDPVKLVIGFAAIDNEQHLEALKELSEILSNDDLVKKIIQAKEEREIFEIIKQFNGVN
ncbi:MAG: hypothetical protein CBR30_09115 [Dictyoglomus sp. NZ13-RE01]|nr:MAG: hypothetical protein CBR30_09115 [Dictyoglomus sp. NZ13-RE01]